uniref:Portal protein n=1 Tax=Siphoviridae sp. ctu061 TaxID=2825710 RepID=A0A8S5U6I6_9CAUD|nr:MAG TPA: Portal protein [Siphoviridae sp. ctu061]
MAEIGRIGQKRWNGVLYEEFLRDLQGIRGVEVYREMANNDDTIGAILFAIKMLIRHTVWNIEPGGDSAKDREASEFVESCMGDMQSTWTDTISEILSFLVYGWSLHEIVYKRRMGKSRNPRTNSKYSDGLIGWQKLPIRSQDTLYKWEYDKHDNLVGMTQMPPPDYGFITIPMKKAMLFRTESAKDNPEGRSILRNAYRPWYFKRRIQEIEAIGIERDLAGLPVFHAPDGTDIWDDTDPDMVKINAALTKMVKSVRRDEYEGLVLPHGFEFELVSTGGARQFDTNAIINRYDTKIAMTVLADFLMLGHNKVGSFALSSDKTELFSVAISAFLDVICETFNNQSIPALIDINGDHFNGITDYPKMTHGEIEDVDMKSAGQFIKDMTGIGVIVPDDGLEDYVREIGHLPERTTDSRREDPKRTKQQNQNQPPEDESEEQEEIDDDQDEKNAEAAKQRLGRER